MSTRYSPCTKFKNLLGGLLRPPTGRHARPGRRLRTRHRCPRAITGMTIRSLCSSNLLPRGRRRVRREQDLAQLPPRRERSCASNGSIGLPQKSSGASTRSSPVEFLGIRLPEVQLRLPAPPRRPYPGPPGAMANVEIPGGPPWRTRCSSQPRAPESPKFPSRGEFLGLVPAGGLPPNEPPSLCT